MKISTILAQGRVHLSCEVFPPKEFSGMDQAAQVTREIAALSPAFMSVTYGAAGRTPGHTLALAQVIADSGVTPLCHLTCVQSTRAQVEQVLAQMDALGLQNVLALRGDLPREGEPLRDFAHAADLIAFIKRRGDYCVGAACCPEGHPESTSRRADLDYLRQKVDAGADFLTTQMFFDNGVFYDFLFRALQKGITVPIVAGIMPICDVKLLRRTVALSGANLPPRFAAIADRFGESPAAMTQAGIAFATEQIIDLVANGVDHIHLYTMNKPWIAQRIIENLSEIIGHGQA